MSTGQTSSSLEAISASPAIESSTTIPMKIASRSGIRASSIPSRRGRRTDRELLLDGAGDLVDPLDDRDAGILQAGDLLSGRVLGPLHDGSGMTEAHALHPLVVHELAGHEGDDGQLG